MTGIFCDFIYAYASVCVANSLPVTCCKLKINIDKWRSFTTLLSNWRKVPAAQFLGFANVFLPSNSCVSFTWEKAASVI